MKLIIVALFWYGKTGNNRYCLYWSSHLQNVKWL